MAGSMKPKSMISPAMIALTVAAISVVLLIAAEFGLDRRRGETMFSATITGTSVDTAGATITPTRRNAN